MTTLTIRIPDNKRDRISKIIQTAGGDIIATSDELSKIEQASLNRGIEEAHLIKAGKLKGLSFDDLWD